MSEKRIKVVFCLATIVAVVALAFGLPYEFGRFLGEFDARSSS